MKVINRTEFLKLPEGTVYCCGNQWSFGALSVKGETWGNDWIYISFDWVDGEDSEECLDRLEEMLEKGISYPMNDSGTRDGAFEEDAIFLIYEKEDLLKIKSYIEDAITDEK